MGCVWGLLRVALVPQTVYCCGSQFSLKRCPPLSRWWCPALRMCPNSCVSQSGNSFVSQSGRWCPAPQMSLIHVSPNLAIHLSPSLGGGVHRPPAALALSSRHPRHHTFTAVNPKYSRNQPKIHPKLI